MKKRKTISRRGFLQRAGIVSAGAIGFPYVISSRALGNFGGTPASERITLGFIGVGKQGKGLLYHFREEPGTQVVAACDVDQLKLKRAVDGTNECYADAMNKGDYKGCDGYKYFRDLLARTDIDAVVIATPDHWHAIPVIEAAKAGKDIYCEKPLSLTISQARAMVNAVRQYGRVFQTGSMQRSNWRFRSACELVRNGYIGQLKCIRASVGEPSGPCNLPAETIPGYLDWDLWLGPAPKRPFNAILSPNITNDIYPKWRDYRDYSGGGMTDWGAHHFDIAQWALGMDKSGPVEIIPPNGKDVKLLTYVYANGVPLIRDKSIGGGVLFEGTQGSIHADRSEFTSDPENLIQQTIKPNEIHLYKSGNHYADWLYAIRARSRPICDIETGCRSVTVCHLGNIAYELGRPLKWNPDKEEFVNDDQANSMRSRSMRSPWYI